MLGLYGFCFVDFGETFKVHDKTGEECKNVIISAISNDEKAIVTCHEDKRHDLEDGDYVTFSEVQGMSEINKLVGKVRFITPLSFEVDINTKNFGQYTREGIST